MGGDNEQSSTVQNAANTAKAMRSAQRGARASATSRDGLACGQQVNTHTHTPTRAPGGAVPAARLGGHPVGVGWPQSRVLARDAEGGGAGAPTGVPPSRAGGAYAHVGHSHVRSQKPGPCKQKGREGGREGGWGFVEGSMRYTPGSRTQLSSDVQPTERFTLCGTTSEPLAQIH